MSLLFGTAGIPHASKDRSTAGGVKTISELNLDAMEVQFVRGVKMGEARAREVAAVSKALNIALSVHAPYYINLNSEDKFNDSVKRIVDSVRIGGIFNARNIVFHAAYYQKSSREKVYERVKKGIKRVLDYMEQHGIKTILRPETTGKPTQFGELDELLKLSQELENVMPCVDFAHIHARYRRYNSYAEFCEILTSIEELLGKKGLKNMHMHVSGIDYGLKGEKAHLNLKESDFKYVELLKALKDYRVEGILICESPNLEEDAILLRNTYQSL